ncbi:GntR family transcriptional regulator [Streptomyces sp. MBT53]|uniref:winged helix-turn-helix domain-containing protein n=1 Tax=Streptomyces sp. MBT53 TaxID=1488384 RepID=UPI001913A9D4|nr:GntR family transcriptional regulator [Streptomyces sp. MBT53]MBK6017990.1 FadR family transcriptional regulator [Streptomyces sp. MBT53]
MSEGGTEDGGGREFVRVVRELRALINDGSSYPVGSFLPSQRQLAEDFKVSRDTVQRVLRDLRSEGWIETRQGSGSKVLKRQQIQSPTSTGMVTLHPLFNHAFEKPEVTLDVFTLTSESLDAHIRVQAVRIRAGQITPERITLRMVLPHPSLDIPYWRTADGRHDDQLKARFLGITDGNTASVRGVLNDLKEAGHVPSVTVEIRHGLLVPYSKLYLLNGTEAVHGNYRLYERSITLDNGQEVEGVTDVEGLGAGLTHHVMGEPGAQGTVFVQDMREWFESVWNGRLTSKP